jgi:hypothetical protein
MPAIPITSTVAGSARASDVKPATIKAAMRTPVGAGANLSQLPTGN